MDYNGYKPIHIIIHDNPSIILGLYHIHDILIIVVDLKPWFWCHVHCLLLIFRCMLSYIPSYQGQISHDLVGSMILMPRKRISQIYHLVMTNSLPWKIPMLLRTVNHLFLLAYVFFFSMAMLNNQRVYYPYIWYNRIYYPYTYDTYIIPIYYLDITTRIKVAYDNSLCRQALALKQDLESARQQGWWWSLQLGIKILSNRGKIY